MDDIGFSEEEIVELLPALQAFSHTFVQTKSDIDDLVQEVVTRALANKHRFVRGTRLKSWLFTIMRNTFYNSNVVAKREHTGFEECVADLRSVDPTQELTIRLKEVETAMRSVPPNFLEALMMVALGESCEEAARRCDCAEGTIKSRTSRARSIILAETGEQ